MEVNKKSKSIKDALEQIQTVNDYQEELSKLQKEYEERLNKRKIALGEIERKELDVDEASKNMDTASAEIEEADKGPNIKQLGSLPDGGYRTIRDIAAANEPSNIKRGYDDRGDYYELYKDASPQDLIRAAVKNAGLDPNSKDGLKMVHDLEAAVDLHVKRIADRHTNKDDLASRQPIKMTRKGTPNKQDMRARKKDIEYKLGLEEMKVSKEQLKALIKEELDAVMKEAELEEAEMTEMKGLDKLDPKHSEMAMQARQDRGRLISDKDFYDDGGNQTVSEWIEETLELLNVDPASPEAMALEQKLRAIAKEHVLDDEDEDELGENKLGLEEKEDKQMKQIAESFRRFTKILKD